MEERGVYGFAVGVAFVVGYDLYGLGLDQFDDVSLLSGSLPGRSAEQGQQKACRQQG